MNPELRIPSWLIADATADALVWHETDGDMLSTDDEAVIESIARHVALAADLGVGEYDLYLALVERDAA